MGVVASGVGSRFFLTKTAAAFNAGLSVEQKSRLRRMNASAYVGFVADDADLPAVNVNFVLRALRQW